MACASSVRRLPLTPDMALRQTVAGGKNFCSAISSMKAIGRSTDRLALQPRGAEHADQLTIPHGVLPASRMMKDSILPPPRSGRSIPS